VTKDALLRKLDGALDNAAHARMYGTLEIEFRAGEPVFIRTTQQEKLDETENRSNGRQSYR
jgi:hypothetical protein